MCLVTSREQQHASRWQEPQDGKPSLRCARSSGTGPSPLGSRPRGKLCIMCTPPDVLWAGPEAGADGAFRGARTPQYTPETKWHGPSINGQANSGARPHEEVNRMQPNDAAHPTTFPPRCSCCARRPAAGHPRYHASPEDISQFAGKAEKKNNHSFCCSKAAEDKYRYSFFVLKGLCKA